LISRGADVRAVWKCLFHRLSPLPEQINARDKANQHPL